MLFDKFHSGRPTDRTEQSLTVDASDADLLDDAEVSGVGLGLYLARNITERMGGVITVDTAVAHLAGSLGVPTWVLVPRVPDWRWGYTGERTDWYPSMRLMRQEQKGDWTAILERVRRDLGSLARQEAA